MWHVPLRIERAYQQALLNLLRRAPNGSLFKKLTEAAALRMVSRVSFENAKDWRQAAQQGMQGDVLYRALQKELSGAVGKRVRELIAENAQLISSVPEQARLQVARQAARENWAGRRSFGSKLANRWQQLTKSRARTIARTETSKATTALTQARSEQSGLRWYVWRSSKDQRVRFSHRFMARDGGVLIPWTEPPAPEALVGEKSTLGYYHAGNCPNCRCYPEPLLRMSQVQWPHRVYLNGRVQMMTRAQFMPLAGKEVRAA